MRLKWRPAGGGVVGVGASDGGDGGGEKEGVEG